MQDKRDYTEPRESAPLIARRSPLAGQVYLSGFVAGYHNRPAVIQGTKKAQAMYTRGYEAGAQARAAAADQKRVMVYSPAPSQPNPG